MYPFNRTLKIFGIITMLSLIGGLLIYEPVYSQVADMRKTTDGGSLDILLEPSPQPLENKGQSNFTISFLQPSTDKIQVHVDYDFIIEKDGSTIYQASQQLNQPVLHTAEGIVKIPYGFNSSGDHSVKVVVMGINFLPIKSESASFSINVIPEFPPGIAMTVTALILAVIIFIIRRFNNFSIKRNF